MLRIALHKYRGLFLAALVLAAAPLAAPEAAFAQYREFAGKIDKINKKKLIVDNRMGDKLKFVPRAEDEGTAVEGQDKSTWKDLKPRNFFCRKMPRRKPMSVRRPDSKSPCAMSARSQHRVLNPEFAQTQQRHCPTDRHR